MTMLSLKLYKVTGKFLVPGSRECDSFSGKVLAETITHACDQLAPVIESKVKDKLRNKEVPSWAEYKITSAFVRANLRFEEIKKLPASAELVEELAPKVIDESPVALAQE
jgi:hypothetical protein